MLQSIAHRNLEGALIHSFRWSRTTHCEEAEGELVRCSDRHHGDQVPQQQDDRELQGQAECPIQNSDTMQGLKLEM